MRRILWVAALVGFLAFQVYWFGRVTPTEQRLATVAAAIAGREVEVRCPSIWRRLIDVSGFKGTATIGSADGGRPVAHLAHDVCKTFEHLPERGFPADVSCLAAAPPRCDSWTMDVSIAVHVLSHESWHLAGIADEGTTECYAWQTDAEVARRFGASAGTSDQIAAFLASQGDRASLPQYRPPAGCNPGGRLDLRPETSNWPS